MLPDNTGTASRAPASDVRALQALRSLVLVDLDWTDIGQGFVGGGDLGALMLALNVRTINRYD